MNTNKTIGIVIGALIVIVGAFMIVKGQHTEKTSDAAYTEPTTSAPTESLNPNGSVSTTPSTAGDTKTPVTSPTPSKPVASGYTSAQVATHNSSASCWTIVNGTVYDVTSWISKHPGGQGAIKGMCGIDASAQFNEQHGGQGGPERVLASFKIGALIK